MAKITGRKELLRKLAEMPQAVRQAVKPAIEQGAQEVITSQKRLVPVDTGNLSSSIVATTGGKIPRYASMGRSGQSDEGDPDLTVIVTAGDDLARHAHLVEFGTAPHIVGGIFAGAKHPGTKAQAFFYPGYRLVRRRVKTRISRAIGKAVRGTAKK